MANLIVGTAGHIDHGKSALVEALTGTDPDRLAEEKRRGITIELGFADLELDEERGVSFVDVPGHERFVRHMVAGATGIDAVLLVIAADQGVQPQTREHLDICRLLGVRRGLVAINKCDLADDELVEVVGLEAHDLVSGSFLAGAEIVPVSARAGIGLDELRAALGRLFERCPTRAADGVLRLPIDRSFTMRGFGTVVTGTLVSGRVEEGETLALLPSGGRARVRGLQVHGRKVDRAAAGQRVALNLQGLDCDDVPRGTTLTHEGALMATRRAWGRLNLLPDAPASLARGGRVRFHQGTSEGPARYRVLGRSGDALRIQVHLGETTVLAPGDRFILRQPSPVNTIGGGVVVDASPPRARRARAEAFDLDVTEPARIVRLRLQRAGALGVGVEQLAPWLGWLPEDLRAHLEELADAGEATRVGSTWLALDSWTELVQRITEELGRFHEAEPLRAGIARELLRSRVAARMPQDAWRAALDRLQQDGLLELQAELVALGSHEIVMRGEELELYRRIEDRFRDAGLEPPRIEDVLTPEETAQAAPIVDRLLSERKLSRIRDGRLFHAEALEELRRRVRDYAKSSPTIDVAGFKELAGVTRKNAIPLLEQLDEERATRRKGNVREILL